MRSHNALNSADEGVPGIRSVAAAAQISNSPLAGEGLDVNDQPDSLAMPGSKLVLLAAGPAARRAFCSHTPV